MVRLPEGVDWFGLFCAVMIVFVALTTTVGMATSKYLDHVLSLEAIRAGYVQTVDPESREKIWVKER